MHVPIPVEEMISHLRKIWNLYVIYICKRKCIQFRIRVHVPFKRSHLTAVISLINGIPIRLLSRDV